MRVEMSNEQMRQAINALNGLNEKGRLGYAIVRNARRLKDAAQEYLVMQEELVRKYGVPDRAGNIKVPADRMEEFTAEMGDIPTITHEVEIFTISENDFCSGSLTSRQMEQLLFMVEE